MPIIINLIITLIIHLNSPSQHLGKIGTCKFQPPMFYSCCYISVVLIIAILKLTPECVVFGWKAFEPTNQTSYFLCAGF